MQLEGYCAANPLENGLYCGTGRGCFPPGQSVASYQAEISRRRCRCTGSSSDITVVFRPQTSKKIASDFANRYPRVNSRAIGHEGKVVSSASTKKGFVKRLFDRVARSCVNNYCGGDFASDVISNLGTTVYQNPDTAAVASIVIDSVVKYFMPFAPLKPIAYHQHRLYLCHSHTMLL